MNIYGLLENKIMPYIYKVLCSYNKAKLLAHAHEKLAAIFLSCLGCF